MQVGFLRLGPNLWFFAAASRLDPRRPQPQLDALLSFVLAVYSERVRSLGYFLEARLRQACQRTQSCARQKDCSRCYC